MGFLFGLITQANIHSWYQDLNKSSLTPPGFVFSIVWIFLYALLAMVAWMLSTSHRAPSKLITTLFILQLMMNWSWTLLFFQWHYLILSAIWLMILTVLNIVLIIHARTKHSTIAWLLLPYVVWLIFACYLNGVIALTN